MNRFLRIFLHSVLLILLVTGCSKPENKSATKEVQAEESSEVVTANGIQVPDVIEGLWVGAFELEKESVYLRVELKSEDGGIKLTVVYMLPGAPGAVGDVRLESSRVNFELTRDSDTIAFDGRLQGDTITGVVERAGKSGTFGLVRWVQVDATIYDDYMGAYELGNGRIVVIRRHDFLKLDPPYPISTSWLSYVEESGRIGRLYPSSETTFFSGPTYLVPFPVEVEVTFVRNQEGKVSGLVWREQGRAEQTASRSTLYREEKVTFRNGDITLAGRLLVPNTKGPHPAVIMIQGGGPTNRNLPVFPEYVFARHGIAALVYDGRGTGASTGGAWRESSFGDLAEDALAGVEFLRHHKDINPKQVGLWGFTDGGGAVSSLAASRSKDVAFLILVSAPGLRYAEQLPMGIEAVLRVDGFSGEEIEEALAFVKLEADFVRTGEGWEKLEAAVRTEQDKKWFSYTDTGSWGVTSENHWAWRFSRLRADHNPVSVLSTVTCPVLAIWGELDTWTPPEPNKSIVEKALREGGNTDYTLKVFAKGGHSLWLAGTGGVEDWLHVKTHAPGYFETMTEWLLKRVDVAR